MKIWLVLLLCILASQQCEASRKVLMERMEVEGNKAQLSVPKKMLLESVDDGDGMETEIMLPDDSDDEKPEIIIEEEKKRSKRQEDLVMEAIEEQTSEEKKQKQPQEGESNLLEIGDGDLLMEESKEETWTEDKPQKKKEKYSTKESSTENDSSGLSMGDTFQEEGENKVTAKKETALMDDKVSGEPTEDSTPAYADKGEVVEGFSVDASSAETANETGIVDFLLETVEKQDGSTIIKEEMQDGDAKSKKKTKKVEKAGKLEKEGSKSKTSDDETSETKEDEVEESVIEKKGKKGGGFEVSKSKRVDDKDLTGEAMVEEITNEETAADLIEREMQGGVEDLVTSASKAEEGDGEKTRRKDDGHTEKYADANENGGGEDKEKPLKKLKTAKKPKFEALQEADSEGKVFDTNDKKKKTKVKKIKDSQSKLDVTIAEPSDLLSKQVDMEDTAKSQMKKKKKVKPDKVKKEEKPSMKGEKNPDVFEEEVEFFDKTKENRPETSAKKEKSAQKEEEKSSKKIEKREKRSTDDKKEGSKERNIADGDSGEDTQDLKILEVVDQESGEAVKDISKEKDDLDDKHLKGTEEELPTIDEQEEKLEIEAQGIAKEAQENAEGSSSVSKSLASSTDGVDEEDDEYSDFMQDFSDLSTKLQDTALKVADHLGPNIQKITDTSKTYFNKANQQITDSFSPLIGKQFAPFFASLLSYGLLLVPLAVVIILFEHIRAMLSLQKVLLFVNIYLAAYFATLLLATFIMGEPMTFFYRSSASGYVHLQLLQALGYVIYLILQTVDLVSSCSSEAHSTKVTVALQWFVAVTIGFHYYVTIFHRAMVLKAPHTNWKIYGIYSCAFLVLCLFARIKRVKKGYVQVGQADTDKKH